MCGRRGQEDVGTGATEAGVYYVRESMRRATGSWHVQCVRACGVRREAGVCDVCEHAACDGKLVCAMCEGKRRALCYGKLACTMCVSIRRAAGSWHVRCV